MKEQAARKQDWTLDMCKFSAVLKGLKEISAPEDIHPEHSHGGEQAAQQTEGICTPKPEKAGKAPKKKKRVRDEGIVEAVVRTPSPSGDSSKHAAMYSRRKQQKMVKRYSATDIAAILGHAPGVCRTYLHYMRAGEVC
ncbi:MAG: hypothetical protein HC767_07620 [Akkermansiaceae bacterium]|nr:hypothetical protein [Akkermansiaceae bacterium]